VYRLYCSLPILCTGCACQLIIKDNDDDDDDDDLSFRCFMCGMKDSLRSKITPRNLVSSIRQERGYRLAAGSVLGGVCAIYRSVCIPFLRERT